jgi:pyrroline-5-carboxylate reductase
MQLTLDGTLLIAGAGNMGGALLAGWLERGLDPRRIVVQDPSPPPPMQALLDRYGMRASAAPVLEAPPAVIVVAIKPQLMDEVFPPLARHAGPATLVLSVAAGRTLAGFEAHLPAGTPVVRTIPNTPASVGRGITACVASRAVTASHRLVCDQLLGAVGEVVWLDDETQIDLATAVSGSGPAYVFLLAECLAAAGREAGLSADVAARLARATVAGAGEMLHRSALPPDQLRRNVTSPNGTTAAALEILMAPDAVPALMAKAVAAAARRSRELAS